ncbi:YigZ family protein [Shewanella surugensis]|uniref:YigZ family protein n=1 Tax=Shewanella surugensis TaxID=212020 RepID=A0ABT0LDF5_9GAMM|nr:YigZ family protein [Shewanella surugensis]MCL1125350.1 YigZ family protein [Shewanella surugensis]
MSERYLIPSVECVVEEEIKHSRFISILFHCPEPQMMKTQLASIKHLYPGANHYCYAFVCGEPKSTLSSGFSDDGEPSGSAGKPMLAHLQGCNIGEVGAIVVRYFGGTKLGVGGLVRAYSSGVRQGLKTIETMTKQLRYPAFLECEYGQLIDVEYFLSQYDAVIEDKQFTDKVKVSFAIAKAFKHDLNRDLATISQGSLVADFSH